MTFAEPDLRRRAFLFTTVQVMPALTKTPGGTCVMWTLTGMRCASRTPVNLGLTEERNSGLAASFAASARHPYTFGREHRQQSV